MKLTVRFKDGKKDSAYVSGETLKRLKNGILDENGYDDESEIDDWDYVSYAISEHEYLRIFDREYKVDDIESFEVNRKANETKAQKVKREMSYLSIYNEALTYAEDFFRYNMVRVFPQQKDGHATSPDILPITFITDDRYEDSVNGMTSVLGKQAIIRVRLQENELTKKLKSEIRHEIIHYTLWLAGLPNDDDSAEFWALAAAYDAMPYDIPEGKTKEYFDVFIRFFRSVLEPWEDLFVKPLFIGKAIASIQKYKTVNGYDNYLKKLAEEAEQWCMTVNLPDDNEE